MPKHVPVEANIEWMFRGRTIAEIIELLQECAAFCGAEATLRVDAHYDDMEGRRKLGSVFVSWHREETQEDRDAWASEEARRMQRERDYLTEQAARDFRRERETTPANSFVEASRQMLEKCPEQSTLKLAVPLVPDA